MNYKKLILWVAKFVVAVIFVETLFFKFTAHPESVLIFSQLGIEPWGRILLGIVELMVAISIFIPKVSMRAAYIAAILMVGAIFTHIFFIGVNFNGDSGGLFRLALIALFSSIIVIILNRIK